MIVSIFQTNPTIGDVSGNVGQICNAIHTKKQSNLLVFPELALQGYMPYDFFVYKQEQALTTAIEAIAKSLEAHQKAIVGIALPSQYIMQMQQMRGDGISSATAHELQSVAMYNASADNTANTKHKQGYARGAEEPITEYSTESSAKINTELDLVKPLQLINTACVIDSQGLYHIQPKQELPHYDVFFESRYFSSATQLDSSSNTFFIELPSTQGQSEKIKVGILICEDIWRQPSEYAGGIEGEILPRGHNAKVALTGSTPHEAPIAQLARQRPNLLVCISASPFEHDKLQKRIAVSKGAVRHIAAPLLFANLYGANDEVVFDGASFAMDKDGTILDLRAFCKYDCADYLFRDGALHPLAAERAQLDYYTRHANSPKLKNIVTNRYIDMAKIYRILLLGLQDYMQKTGVAKKVHLGLSGGIDSAVTAVLAADALGKDNVVGILLPSKYTSKASVDDAQALASRLGVATHEVSIRALYALAMQELAEIFAQNKVEPGHTLAEENLQARLRGLLLMAYSNKHSSMLLTTGNKSEIATGYCTLYGDMSGSLNLIGDLYKTEVYELARYLNVEVERIPQTIIDKAPTAELRENQKDSDSLPIYSILDSLLYQFIECRKSPSELIACQIAESKTIEKVWQLYIRSEYKRKQAAPIIKLSAQAFGRGRLVPLASNFIRMQ